MSGTGKTRERIKAKAWMVLNRIRQVDIQKALDFTHDTQVTETLRGIRNNRAVLQYLLDAGCPADYLHLPEDMKQPTERTAQ
ncbi:hypothetical protein [Desulfofustis glycolicus]|uniref:Uncharacterized protein n=1 Tax=Desulfofustis glycolicus DSM 9705 TaxID=1121409 RepID=A0A1M5S6Q8_9BACT|nr:hypothetical protein [Desulfofustis glycolicus]SHH34130.1 hypothetical protein SAMN02745124_00188 [Desulfofustis glycolicus DSM 9705]